MLTICRISESELILKYLITGYLSETIQWKQVILTLYLEVVIYWHQYEDRLYFHSGFGVLGIKLMLLGNKILYVSKANPSIILKKRWNDTTVLIVSLYCNVPMLRDLNVTWENKNIDLTIALTEDAQLCIVCHNRVCCSCEGLKKMCQADIYNWIM